MTAITNNILKWLKYITILLLFVLLYLFFSWWGVIGYTIFVLLIVAKILYTRWDDYKAITKYGERELDKALGGRKYGNKNKKIINKKN